MHITARFTFIHVFIRSSNIWLSYILSRLFTQDEIARIRKRKRGRNMLNGSGNTTDNLCFRYRFRDVFSRFRCCVYNGTGPLLRKHKGNMELHVSATFQKYGNMWFRPVLLLSSIHSDHVLTPSLYGYPVLILSRLHITYTHILINSFAWEKDQFTHLSVMV